METLGIIGLGKMGSQLCGRLLKAGYTVIGYNRTKDKAVPLIELGMQWANSPKEVIQSCSIVFMSLPDDKVVSAVVEGEDGILSVLTSGKILIDMSTISPDTSRKLAKLIQNKQGQMLDAPISGAPIAVQQGTAMIMVGGQQATFIKVKPILEALSSKIYYVGSNGQALFLKLAINISLAAQFYAFSEGVILAEKAGLDIKNAIEIMKQSAIASPGIQIRAPFILSPPEQSLFTIKMMQKDLLLALDQGRQLGVPLLNAALANEMLSLACGHHHGEDDLSFVFQSMKEILESK